MKGWRERLDAQGISQALGQVEHVDRRDTAQRDGNGQCAGLEDGMRCS